MSEIEIVSTARCFGGVQAVYRHDSHETGTPMRFAVFHPPQVKDGPVPVVWWLSGLTCTEENFITKAGAQRAAAELGLMLIAPDTSPRGDGVADDPAYDLGQGAGFYLDATEAPWAAHFRMGSYIERELPAVLAEHFTDADLERQGISGHSMGGHGALTVALRNPGRFAAISAFSPIVAPAAVPWGRKALAAYLGPEGPAWRRSDATALIEDGVRLPELLVDIGTADPFLERELQPERLLAACAGADIPLTLRMQEGYDHSYFFIASFIAEHLLWHAQRLRA